MRALILTQHPVRQRLQRALEARYLVSVVSPDELQASAVFAAELIFLMIDSNRSAANSSIASLTRYALRHGKPILALTNRPTPATTTAFAKLGLEHLLDKKLVLENAGALETAVASAVACGSRAKTAVVPRDSSESGFNLTGSESKIFAELKKNAGAAVDRASLFKAIGYKADAQSRSLNVHLSSLRKKLAQHDLLILTVFKSGYRLVDLREAPDREEIAYGQAGLDLS